MFLSRRSLIAAGLAAGIALSPVNAHAVAGHVGNHPEATAELTSLQEQLLKAQTQEEIDALVNQVAQNPEKFFKESSTLSPLFGGGLVMPGERGQHDGGIYPSFAGMETPFMFGHYQHAIEQTANPNSPQPGTVGQLGLTPLGERILFVSLALASGVDQTTGNLPVEMKQLFEKFNYQQAHSYGTVQPLSQLVSEHISSSTPPSQGLANLQAGVPVFSESHMPGIVTEADIVARAAAQMAGIAWAQKSYMATLSDEEQITFVKETATVAVLNADMQRVTGGEDIFKDVNALTRIILELSATIPESTIESFRATDLNWLSTTGQPTTNPGAAVVSIGLEHGRDPFNTLLEQHGITRETSSPAATSETSAPDVEETSSAPEPSSEAPQPETSTSAVPVSPDESNNGTQAATLANTGAPLLPLVLVSALISLLGAGFYVRKSSKEQ